MESFVQLISFTQPNLWNPIKYWDGTKTFYEPWNIIQIVIIQPFWSLFWSNPRLQFHVNKISHSDFSIWNQDNKYLRRIWIVTSGIIWKYHQGTVHKLNASIPVSNIFVYHMQFNTLTDTWRHNIDVPIQRSPLIEMLVCWALLIHSNWRVRPTRCFTPPAVSALIQFFLNLFNPL